MNPLTHKRVLGPLRKIVRRQQSGSEDTFIEWLECGHVRVFVVGLSREWPRTNQRRCRDCVRVKRGWPARDTRDAERWRSVQ